MSKTIRHQADSTERSGKEAPDKQDVPDPYPPVEPVVARRDQKRNK